MNFSKLESFKHLQVKNALIFLSMVTTYVAAALGQGPSQIDRTFCLLWTFLATVLVLRWLKGRYGLPEDGTSLDE